MVAWPYRGDIAERHIYDMVFPKFLTGTTDIDDSAQTDTTAFHIIEIAPIVHPLADVEVWLDLAKATTGYAAVESTATIQIAVARKVDGTNWRREAYNEAALSGTNAANRMQKLNLGSVSVAAGARIYIVMSADATSDMEIPYVIAYKGLVEPTVTVVAA